MQSALLEAMQERQVTIGDDDATRCPSPSSCWPRRTRIEQEGTYPLPEAQVDRFMLKLRVGYPTHERGAADPRPHGDERAGPAVLTPWSSRRTSSRSREVVNADLHRRQGEGLHRRPGLRDARPGGVQARRSTALIRYGASPRATIASPSPRAPTPSSQGRGYVTPQDVKAIALDVLRHRVIVSYEAEAEDVDADALVRRVLDGVPVP